MHKIIAFTDQHFPWADKKALKKLYNLISYEKPDIIICLGDDYDLFNFGGYNRNPNIMTPDDELAKGYLDNTIMWQEIFKASRHSKMMRISGNHNSRISKQIINKYPAILSMIDDSNLYDFKGVENIEDKGFIEIDNIIFCHGWGSSPVMHRNHFNKSVVHGHTHKAELRVDFNHKTGSKPFFGVACGCMIDFKAPVFDYMASKHTNWKHAACIIEHGFPRLVLL